MARKPKVDHVDSAGIERDRFKRPILLTPDGDWKAYTRVSTLAETLAEHGPGLTNWACKNTAVGIARDSELFWEASDILVEHGHDPFTREGKAAWKELVTKARSLANEDYWAEVGTTIHSLVEARYHQHVWHPSEDEYRWIPHAEDIWDTLDRHGYDVLDAEVFVVNEELGAAGTLDLLLRERATGGVLVGDLKTGQHDAAFPLKVMTQVATYANSERYEPGTGERESLHEFWNASKGLLVHCPAKFRPATKLYELNLIEGYELARESAKVRTMQKVSKLIALEE